MCRERIEKETAENKQTTCLRERKQNNHNNPLVKIRAKKSGSGDREQTYTSFCETEPRNFCMTRKCLTAELDL